MSKLSSKHPTRHHCPQEYAFTVIAHRKKKSSPPSAGAFRQKMVHQSLFRKFYERGDLPVLLEHDARGYKLFWKIELDKMDFHHFLPVFFDGLKETTHPHKFLALQGSLEMINQSADRIQSVIPQLIIPLKSALETKQPEVVCSVLKVIQAMVNESPQAGELLVPYYRQLLPIMNLFKCRNDNFGDAIDYRQCKRDNLGDLISETLQVLEKNGGSNAFINIKYMIPTYESSLIN